MADKVIWNDDMTMNFLAHEYQAARIVFPDVPADRGRHWVRIYMKGTDYSGNRSAYAGLQYEVCKSKEAAKECLVRLIEKLTKAGVIEATENSKVNRFDNVELPEVE